MPPEPRGLVLAVVQIRADADPGPAFAGLAAARRVLVRPPALAELPRPSGVELVVDPVCDRAGVAARLRRDAAETIIVLHDDERLSPELAAALDGLGPCAAAARHAAARRVHFLGREIHADPVTIAWTGAVAATPPPRPLPGHVASAPASVTTLIDRLEALATHTAPVGTGEPLDFVGRPLAAVVRRLWRGRRNGIPGFVLAIVETYGEVLRAAQAWERDGIAARRAERQSGVPQGFHHWRTPMGSLTLRDGTPPALREALLDATPDVVAGMPLAGGRGAVWAVTLGTAGRGVLRWYRRGGAIRHLVHDRYFGWTPRPIRELAVTEAVIQRGVPAPEVLAARVDRLPWGWYRGAIVTREVSDAATLADELRRLPAGPVRTATLAAVGRAVRDLHDRGVHHRDLNANNVLVRRTDGDLRVHFIDFDRAVLRSRLVARIRTRELRRLARSLAKLARGGMPLAPDDLATLRRAYDGDAA